MFVLLASFVCACAPSAGSMLIGKPAPSTRVTLLSDNSLVPLSQFTSSNRPLVIAFWASDCNFSPGKIKSLNHLAHKLKPRGVQFLAVSIDKAKDIGQLTKMIRERKFDQFTHAFSGNDIYDEAYTAFKGNEVPYFVVIDANGTIVASGDSPDVVADYFGAPE